MSLDAQIHHEQFPPECRRCKHCRLVAYHRDGYTPADLSKHDGCWTCKIRGEPAYFRKYGFTGVGER